MRVRVMCVGMRVWESLCLRVRARVGEYDCVCARERTCAWGPVRVCVRVLAVGV